MFIFFLSWVDEVIYTDQIGRCYYYPEPYMIIYYKYIHNCNNFMYMYVVFMGVEI